MNRITQIITKVIIILFAFVLGIIIIDALFLYTPIIYTFSPVVLVIGIILYLLLLIWIYQKLIPKIENKKYTPVVLIGIFFVCCVMISYLTRLLPKWDMGTIYHFAEDYALKGISLKSHPYLYSYPHKDRKSVV